MGINRVEGTRCISAAVTESPTGWTLNNLEEDQMLPLDQHPINQLPKPREWERKLGLEDLPRGASQVRPLKRTRASQTVQGRATETRTLRSGHDTLSRCLGRARCSFRPRGTSIRKCHGDLTHGGMQWKLGAWGLEAWNQQ